MHGEPASGKTTLARALAAKLNAVVLEMDVITAALVRSTVDVSAPGSVVYELHYSIAEHLLGQGISVVLDNPVYRAFVEQRSRTVADGFGAAWTMIECVCYDTDAVSECLRQRDRFPHQSQQMANWREVPGTSEPGSERLIIETNAPLEQCVRLALDYVNRAASDR